MKKQVTSGMKSTVVFADGDKGYGGANHLYTVEDSNRLMATEFAKIRFQKGPIGEGANGCTNEDLLSIVEHRLQSFQEGPFPCRQNELALIRIQEALHWLEHRNNEQAERGVEGVYTE